MQSIFEMTARNTVEICQKYEIYHEIYHAINCIIMIVKQQSHAFVTVLKITQP